MLDVKKYKLFANIKQRIVDRAVVEINEQTDIIVGYELIKTGRKVTAIRFNYIYKDIEKEKLIAKELARDEIKKMKERLK
jgi:plasmid replication initiation protein